MSFHIKHPLCFLPGWAGLPHQSIWKAARRKLPVFSRPLWGLAEQSWIQETRSGPCRAGFTPSLCEMASKVQWKSPDLKSPLFSWDLPDAWLEIWAKPGRLLANLARPPLVSSWWIAVGFPPGVAPKEERVVATGMVRTMVLVPVVMAPRLCMGVGNFTPVAYWTHKMIRSYHPTATLEPGGPTAIIKS